MFVDNLITLTGAIYTVQHTRLQLCTACVVKRSAILELALTLFLPPPLTPPTSRERPPPLWDHFSVDLRVVSQKRDYCIYGLRAEIWVHASIYIWSSRSKG